MSREDPPVAFGPAHAATYDQRFAKLAPMRDALHLLISAIFADLPAEARILCVGAGTGQELIYLARKFPQWQEGERPTVVPGSSFRRDAPCPSFTPPSAPAPSLLRAT